MPRLLVDHPTERHPFPWKLVARHVIQLAGSGFALGSVAAARFDVATFWVAILCYVELRKWGRA